MINYLVVISGFIFSNIVLFFLLWNDFSNSNKNPKYINTTFTDSLRENPKSLILKRMEIKVENYLNSKKNEKKEIEINQKGKLDLAKLEKKISKNSFNNDIEDSTKKIININHKLNSQKDEIYPKTNENKREKIEFTDNTKVSMFLDHSKKNIFVLKVSNDGQLINKKSFSNKNSDITDYFGEISLFTVPSEKLLIEKKTAKLNFYILNYNQKLNLLLSRVSKNIKSNKFNQEKPSLEKCFKSKFLGKIIGVVSNSNKKNLAIAYEITNNSKVYNRIRYFHNIQDLCYKVKSNDHDFLKFEKKIFDDFNKFVENDVKKKGSNISNDNFNLNKIYFEITESKNSNDNSLIKNFFSNDYYDDFSLGINSPIRALAIKNNIIAFTLDNQIFQYTILEREYVLYSNSHVWKVFSQGPILNKNTYKYFRTNALKFLDEEEENSSNKKILNLIQITSTIIDNKKNYNIYQEIKITGNLTKNKKINFYKYFENEEKNIFHLNQDLKNKINNKYTIKFYEIDLIKEFLSEKIDERNSLEKEKLLNECEKDHFNLKKCIKNFNEYFLPIIFSNNNSNLSKNQNLKEKKHVNMDSILMEFAKGKLLLLESNLKKGILNFFILNPENKKKIQKIYSDEENTNILIVSLSLTYEVYFLNF